MTPEHLRALVAAGTGATTLEMGRLVELVGQQNVSSNAPTRVADALRSLRLLAYPMPLPRARDAYVRIYDPSTLLGQLIAAVLQPDEVSDELLTAVAASLSEEHAGRLETARSSGISHERVRQAVQTVEPLLGQPAREIAAAQVRVVVEAILNDPELAAVVRRDGLRMQALGVALRHALPDASWEEFGCSTTAQFVQFALRGTSYAVGIKDDERPHGRLLSRDAPPRGFAIVE